jgi:hypothetical protein
LTGENFANALPTATSDNGQASYKEFGAGWATLAQGWNGTSRTHAASKINGISAQWTLTQSGGLPSGKYEIFVTYVPATGRDTNATYLIFDSTFSRGTVTVNQTATPASALYQGLAWKSLGKFNITHGKALIRLIVKSNGSVDADGVLLIPAGSATSPLSFVSAVDGASLASIAQILAPANNGQRAANAGLQTVAPSRTAPLPQDGALGGQITSANVRPVDAVFSVHRGGTTPWSDDPFAPPRGDGLGLE